MAELAKQANPDEIDIDDEDEDEGQGPEGEYYNTCETKNNGDCLNIQKQNCLFLLMFTEVQLEQKSVPTAVFGGLKDD